MADSAFRAQRLALPEHWHIISRGTVIGTNQYKPDLAIAYKTEIRAVVESSSTNDRKVSLGELLQAHKFFAESQQQGIVIFSLCGNGKSSPKVRTQAEYLRPYFDYMCRPEGHGVTKVFILREHNFIECIDAILEGNNGGYGIFLIE